MGRVREKLDIDFVISTGDNFYKNGLKGVRDQAFKESFMDIYIAQSLQKPWYSGIIAHVLPPRICPWLLPFGMNSQ
jgi:hypothetical protein